MPYLQYQLNIDPKTEVRVYSSQPKEIFESHIDSPVLDSLGAPLHPKMNVSSLREWGRDAVVTDPFHLKQKQLLIIAHGKQTVPVSYVERHQKKKYFHSPHNKNAIQKIFSLNWLKMHDLPTPIITFVGTADHELVCSPDELSDYFTKPMPGADVYDPSRMYVPNHILHEDFPFQDVLYLKPFDALWMDWKKTREDLGASTELLVHALNVQTPPVSIGRGNPNPFYSDVDIDTDVLFVKKGSIDLYHLIKYLRELGFAHNRYVISCCRNVIGASKALGIIFSNEEVYLRQKSDPLFLSQLKARVYGASQMLISLASPHQIGPLLKEEILLKNIEIEKWEKHYELAKEMYDLYINPLDVYNRLNARIRENSVQSPTFYNHLCERRDRAAFCAIACGTPPY